MNSNRNFFILILVTLLITSCAQSQEVGEEITKTSIRLFNDSNQDIKVLLGINESYLDTFLVIKQEVWISPSYVKNPIFKIFTNSSPVIYRLRLGNIYKIYWNEKKKYWD